MKSLGLSSCSIRIDVMFIEFQTKFRLESTGLTIVFIRIRDDKKLETIDLGSFILFKKFNLAKCLSR